MGKIPKILECKYCGSTPHIFRMFTKAWANIPEYMGHVIMCSNKCEKSLRIHLFGQLIAIHHWNESNEIPVAALSRRERNMD